MSPRRKQQGHEDEKILPCQAVVPIAGKLTMAPMAAADSLMRPPGGDRVGSSAPEPGRADQRVPAGLRPFLNQGGAAFYLRLPCGEVFIGDAG